MDQIDIDLLHLLQENARMTVSELSKKLSLSRPSITERLLRLQERGVIEGFSARISPAKVGKDTILIIQVSDLKVSITEYILCAGIFKFFISISLLYMTSARF